MKCLVIIALIALLAPTAQAARNPAQDNLLAVYNGASDAARRVRVEEVMGVYSVLPPMRHPSEKVDIVKRRQVRLNLWHPIGRLSDQELITRAVRWFVFGRNRYAQGVRGIFSEMPEISEVLLVFHEVIRPEQKGRRRSKQSDQVKPFLAIKLARRDFRRLDPKIVRACLDAGDCRQVFASAFTAAKFNRRYAAQRRAAE